MNFINGYQIVEQIYESVNSSVYRGVFKADNQPVILKILKESYPTPSELIRYKQEYEIIRSLTADGVIKAYDLQRYENSLVMFLEDFGGESLKLLMSKRRFTLEEFLTISIKITESLAAIHSANIIHKDINPSNIVYNLLTGQLKIIDFGISTRLSRDQMARNPNQFEGTLAYIAPEQTGRMNQGIDYRSDFYSLGATLYELLTNRLPFETTDPLELVHCHIAKQTEVPHEFIPSIPKTVSNIVMKLLAKTPEERYQSSWGLKSDLETCLHQLQRTGEIYEMELGCQDISDKFHIPQKLYGREQEVTQLLNTFEQVSQGTSEMMLIAGYSGIGKSAFVNEIHKPIIGKRGYFINGKFDQLNRDIPYAAITQAFQDLIQQLLSEPKTILQTWKKQILEALGPNCQVIIDVIPQLEQIIGEQPPFEQLGPIEAQNRFNLFFQKFISVFSCKEHPLVIFLDDLQWADLPSLKLIELLITDSDSEYLLMIGAYRDNEVSAAHPLMQTLEQIKQVGAIVNQITLRPLEVNHVNRLIADTLICSLEVTKPLANLLISKTGGNPFFLTQLLQFLYKENLLTFNESEGCWQWDIEHIQKVGFTDNVVDLMVRKIARLDANTQNVLKLAACIGNRFNLEVLSVVNSKFSTATASELQPALEAGLIIPLSDDYKVPLLWGQEEISRDNTAISSAFIPKHPESIPYKFLHDRVQQAAYALIPDEEKKQVHLQLGRLLLENAREDELQEKIFEIVNQLNEGAELIVEQSQRNHLAKLNLQAGKKAKASTAYEPALRYLEAGLELLGSDSWEYQYELTLELHAETLESFFLNTKFEQVEKLSATTLQQAKNILDKVKVYQLLILSFYAQFQQQKAINTGVEALQALGIFLELPKEEKELKTRIDQKEETLKLLLRSIQIEELANLPRMTDEHKLAAVSILQSFLNSTVQTDPFMAQLVLLTELELCIKYGNPPQAPAVYAYYGSLLCGIDTKNEIEKGCQFGQLSLDLLNKLEEEPQVKNLQCLVRHWSYGLIMHWKKQGAKELEEMEYAVYKGLEIGDQEHASYNAIDYCLSSMLSTQFAYDLKDLNEKKYQKFLEIIIRTKQEYSVCYLSLCIKIAEHLLNGYDKNGWIIGNSHQEEESSLNKWKEQSNQWLLFIFYLTKTISSYYFKWYESAYNSGKNAEKYIKVCNRYLVAPQHNFYYSLALLAFCNNCDIKQQEKLVEQVNKNQKKMEVWSDFYPDSFQHKFTLVEAEKARILGKNWEAEELYEQAIQGAKQYKFIHEEALAYERAGEFYLFIGKKEIGQFYLKNAHHCYTRWGAQAKARQLELEYPQLFLVTAKVSLNSSITSSTSSRNVDVFDITTVLKASQALASEIVLDKLMKKLMKTVIENAGAEKGFLILHSHLELGKESNWVIEAEGAVDEDDVTVLQSIPVGSIDDNRQIPLLAISVINYVVHTQENVVLHDAANEGQFTRDPYIVTTQPKSILCTPLLHQGKLSGVLYLENNLTTGAFTNDRVEVLRILSAQAAISIENSRFYKQLENYSQTLEQKVEARTEELQEKNEQLGATLQKLKTTQAQIIAQEKLASLGALTAGIAHEIKNPLNFVNNFAELSVELTQELLEELETQKEQLDSNTIESIEEILSALSQNAKKINEHGKRADNIVRGMLMHSGGQPGERQLTDINALLAESANLAYHGMRVREPSFNIAIETHYGNNLGKLSVVPPNISRVFLNVINNACYAAHEKKISLLALGDGEDFLPKLSISTKDLGKKIEIRIRDNGKGIPQEVLNKIFNPFFTTKPTGQGTGLGLSISHDIIVQEHQGEIRVETEVDRYAEFIIALPKNTIDSKELNK